MLKLGMIGASPGNGHPYSWSAIFNGYDMELLGSSDYPGIADYLSKRSLPEEAIRGARVTHIWTQLPKLTERIAKTTGIENVCKNISQLANSVDAILLARDDWKSHLELGLPLLKLGLPIYIDKPIAVDTITLAKLLSAQAYPGQIFSCSALRFSPQLRLSQSEFSNIGPIKYIHCTAPKDWEKYAVHLIDPVLGLYIQNDTIKSCVGYANQEVYECKVDWASGLITHFTTLGQLPAKFQFHVVGEKSARCLVWDDAFTSFKASLEHFVYRVTEERFQSEDEHHRQVVAIIEAGLK